MNEGIQTLNENMKDDRNSEKRINEIKKTSVSVIKSKEIKREIIMSQERKDELKQILKKELIAVRRKMNELEKVMYEYEKLENQIMDSLDVLNIEEESIPEEYVFTGIGNQVFKNVFLKKGLYEIEIESESHVNFYIKTKTNDVFSKYNAKGKYLEHIEKTRYYHIHIRSSDEFKIIMRLIE